MLETCGVEWHEVCAIFLLPQQLFKGKFYYCLGLDVKNITNKSDCLLANYKWVHHKYNFDNLGQVGLFCDWVRQTVWQIHKIPNAERILCFVWSSVICVFYMSEMVSLCNMWLSICSYLFVCPASICLCLSHLSLYLRVLVGGHMNVFNVFTGSDVLVCTGFEGWLGQYHVSWSGCCGSGPTGNIFFM